MITDQELIEAIGSLPDIQYPYEWESNLAAHKTELLARLEKAGLMAPFVFKKRIWMSHPSRLTKEADFFDIVTSFELNLSVKIDATQQFQILKQGEALPSEQHDTLVQIFSTRLR